MHIFYHPEAKEGPLTLEESESKHAVKVMRLEMGDKVRVIDGMGNWFEGEILDPHYKRCALNLVKVGEDTLRSSLHIAIAPTKNIDRLEWFLEKATEIGIGKVSLLLCHHSERKVVKEERLLKIIQSAAKQSQRALFPVLNSLIKFSDFIESHKNEDLLMAYCGDEYPKMDIKEALKGTSTTILIGPEGDFSPEEAAMVSKHISLGEARLRTETAALHAVSAFNLLN